MPWVKPMTVGVELAAVEPKVVGGNGKADKTPEPVPTHVPFTAKHPAARLIPLAKVDEAEVPVMLRYGVERPPPMVEVAVPATFKIEAMVVEPVFVTWKTVVDALVTSESRLLVVGVPHTWSIEYGEVEVPMPTPRFCTPPLPLLWP